MSNNPTQARDHEITLRFLASPQDINIFGNVHGGSVMKWIDEAAYACAAGWSACDCVTVYVSGIRFYKPIHVGDLVETRARLIYTGTTSMHIAVDVRSGNPRQAKRHQKTHCVIIFVALDASGSPASVPVWEPRSPEELAMRDYAVKLMGLRKDVEEEMRPYIHLD
jgi:acyl-CoA hydrolase